MRTVPILAVLLTVIQWSFVDAATTWQEAPALDAQSESHLVGSQSIIIGWSEGNDELRGFSIELGRWSSITIEPVKEVRPIVTGVVGCVVLNNRVAAYSGAKGRWDIVELSEGWGPAENGQLPLNLESDVIVAQDGGHLYTFAASSGRWTSPTDPELQSSESVYRMKHLSGRQLSEKMDAWVSSQNPTEWQGGFMVQNGKVTISSNRQSWRKAAEEFLASVDVPESSTVASALTPLPAPDPYTDLTPQHIRPRQSQLQRQEQDVLRLVAELRDQQSVDDKQRKRLTELVDSMFEGRQEIQLAEVERMERKLQQIRANIELRQQNRERIVERRVEELLDPAGVTTQWNPAGGRLQSASPGVSGRRPAIASGPIGLSGPPHLPLGRPSQLPPVNPTSPRNSALADDWRATSEIPSRLRSHQQRCERLLAEIGKTKANLADTVARLADEERPDGLSKEDRARLTRSLESVKAVRAAQQQSYNAALTDWQSAWNAYQTQLRLKQLDVAEAKAVLEPLLSESERMKKLADNGAASVGELRQLESRVAVSRIDLERAEELLALFMKFEVQEPSAQPMNEAAQN